MIDSTLGKGMKLANPMRVRLTDLQAAEALAPALAWQTMRRAGCEGARGRAAEEIRITARPNRLLPWFSQRLVGGSGKRHVQDEYQQLLVGSDAHTFIFCNNVLLRPCLPCTNERLSFKY